VAVPRAGDNASKISSGVMVFINFALLFSLKVHGHNNLLLFEKLFLLYLKWDYPISIFVTTVIERV